jgi:uncharacterized protein (DUF302 family)
MTVPGLITVSSSFSQQETLARLEAQIRSHGLTLFARVDHAAGAAAVDLQLRPTEVLIFGNARGGTPLMQAAQTTGIDLPLKALVWQDGAGKVWVSYNDPAWIAARHVVAEAAATAVTGMSTVLRALVAGATSAS